MELTFAFVAERLLMLWLQFFLLRTQYYFRRHPRKHPLRSWEICFIIAVLWIIFGVLSRFVVIVSDFAVLALERMDILPQWWSDSYSHDSRRPSWGSGIQSLFYNVLTTWLLHRGVTFFLETIVPLWRDIRIDSDSVLEKLYNRSSELWGFLREINWRKGLKPASVIDFLPKSYEKKSHQLISLERHQTDDPQEGQRTLSWKVVVDKKALDEMKETLGPPGGFGEMGFHVEREGVCFEAMGIGTRFNLRFVLKKEGVSGSGEIKARNRKTL